MADPGFSPGGCANSQKCYYFSIFSQKLHENERILHPGGARVPGAPPLDPPMESLQIGAKINTTDGAKYQCELLKNELNFIKKRINQLQSWIYIKMI